MSMWGGGKAVLPEMCRRGKEIGGEEGKTAWKKIYGEDGVGQVHNAWGRVDGGRDRWREWRWRGGLFHVACASGLQVFIIFCKSSEGAERGRGCGRGQALLIGLIQDSPSS